MSNICQALYSRFLQHLSVFPIICSSSACVSICHPRSERKSLNRIEGREPEKERILLDGRKSSENRLLPDTLSINKICFRCTTLTAGSEPCRKSVDATPGGVAGRSNSGSAPASPPDRFDCPRRCGWCPRLGKASLNTPAFSLASLRGGGCRRARPAALRRASGAPRRILAGLPFFCPDPQDKSRINPLSINKLHPFARFQRRFFSEARLKHRHTLFSMKTGS